MGEEVRGFPAVRWGLSFGIVLVVVIGIPWVWVWTNSYHPSISTTVAQTNAYVDQLASTVTAFACGAGIAFVLSCFLAGFLTARDTGTVGSGALAAALACLAFSIVFIVVFSVILRISAATLFKDLGNVPGEFHVLLALTTTFSAMCNLLIGALIAAGIGALGALLGCAIYGRASYS